MNSLKVGDKIIYPNQGLGIIEAIREESYNGESLKVFRLRILSNDTLVLVPSASAIEIGIRRPVPESSINKVFRYMRNGSVDITMDWKGRYKEHLSLMKSGSLFEIAQVLKGLYYLNMIKPLSFREKKMMEKAKELIVSEISEASDVPGSKIEERILISLARCFKDVKPRVAS
jgi:CarD family transcriptional regulator